MKVRWTKVSLRLRITPGELEALEPGEPVVERLQFGEGQGWETAIIPSDAATDLACVGGTVQITLSLADCCSSDRFRGKKSNTSRRLSREFRSSSRRCRPISGRLMPAGSSVPVGAPRRRVARPILPDQTTLPELGVCQDRRWLRERLPGRKP
jgi:hypothetical protein